MPINGFISAIGFIGAIIILRANQWVKYRDESNCVTTTYLGLIWSYCAVVIGIVAIAIVVLNPGTDEIVQGRPIELFSVMVLMALFDLFLPISTTITKSIFGKIQSVSLIDKLDGRKHYQRVVGGWGKVAIIVELLLILILVVMDFTRLLDWVITIFS
ncbi:MAG: hypothetical protein PHE50_05205 [Dehalococcoidales bacterium]|nr:hypothetical protein [Dehalococcoidales bacterium]